jgi:signal transduction histidine kinase
MKKRSILMYWLLLLIPTLLIGVVGIQLLRHEQERLYHVERSSARDRAGAIAEAMQITVETLEHAITTALFNIPDERLTEELREWNETNPLIRNVFIWRLKQGLKLPPIPGASPTSEEMSFMDRYRALFSGRIPWNSEGQMGPEVPKPAQQVGGFDQRQIQQNSAEPNLVRDVRKLRSGRLKLQQLIKQRTNGFPNKPVDQQKNKAGSEGWIPWFSDNKLYVLGWVKKKANGPVYGVELELVSLLSRLIVDFPVSAPKGMVYALIDDGGRILHRAGEGDSNLEAKPDAVVSLAPHLPHWQVAVYFTDNTAFLKGSTAFALFSGLLLAIFILAIILGGTLLSRQAHRNWLDAQQKSSFVSNVSHELKTPLTSIRMYAELLSENRIKEPDKRKRYLEVIVSESQRLTRLVNNVLDFSRLEQGRMRYHFEALEVTAFLGEILETHRMRLQEAGMKPELQIPDKEIVVWADRDALEQSLLNIVDNSIKYASEGGELTIVVAASDRYCELRIMDRGPGVPLKSRENIFQKFQRVDTSLTARQPGSGLGLTIARSILRDQGGDLLYEPREGGGSCFVVQVPLQSAAGSRTQERREPSP